MASSAAVGVLLLLCIVRVQGFTQGGVPAVNGIYQGRFGDTDINKAVQAVFSQGGVEGNVNFFQPKPGAPVQIHVNLLGLERFPDGFQWRIHQNPIHTSLLKDFRCSTSEVGGIFGNGLGDLSARLGTLRPDQPWQTFTDPNITLFGSQSIVGRPLVISREDGGSGNFICANIEQLGAKVQTLRAGFNNGVIQGDVIIRLVTGRDDALVHADIRRIDPPNTNINSMGHTWSLYSGSSGENNSCTNVDIVFGSASYTAAQYNCNFMTQRECRAGDLTSKCGPLNFVNGTAEATCSDNQLGTIPRSYIFDELDPRGRLTVRIGDGTPADGPLGCATLEKIVPQTARAQFRTNTIFGDFLFWQTGPDDRTFVRAHLTGLNRNTNYSLRIYQGERMMGQSCASIGSRALFRRTGRIASLPLGDRMTNDACVTGNLDSVLPIPIGSNSLRTTQSSSFHPLFGPFTLVGNTLALINDNTNMVIACANIMREPDYPQGRHASLIGYQNLDNPPLPPP